MRGQGAVMQQLQRIGKWSWYVSTVGYAAGKHLLLGDSVPKEAGFATPRSHHPLFGQPLLLPGISIPSLHALHNSLSPPSRVHIHHELRIRPRHNFDISIHSKRIIELARRFCLAVLDIPNFGVYAHLDAGLCWGPGIVTFACDDWWVCVDYCCG